MGDARKSVCYCVLVARLARLHHAFEVIGACGMQASTVCNIPQPCSTVGWKVTSVKEKAARAHA